MYEGKNIDKRSDNIWQYAKQNYTKQNYKSCRLMTSYGWRFGYQGYPDMTYKIWSALLPDQYI